jgi:hypothetical protein
MPTDENPCTYPQAFDAELKAIGASRQRRLKGAACSGDELKTSLTGLALSGGGIRSATFNLGLIQGLCKAPEDKGAPLLSRFDYLSTVSGGGYIGSWLMALFHRAPEESASRVSNVASRLQHHEYDMQKASEDGALHFIRNYSNYLSPQIGFFSGDSWSLLGTYLRNVILNLAIITLLLAAVMMGPRMLAWISTAMLQPDTFDSWMTWLYPSGPWITLALFAVLSVNAVLRIAIATAQIAQRGASTDEKTIAGIKLSARETADSPASAASVKLWVVFGLLASSWCVAMFMSMHLDDLTKHWWADALGGTVLHSVLWMIVQPAARRVAEGLAGGSGDGAESGLEQGVQGMGRFWVVVPTAAVAGFIGGALIYVLASIFKTWNWGSDYPGANPAFEWHMLAYGVPLTAGVFLLTAVFHLGLLGTEIPDLVREWWARVGGLIMAYGATWAIVFTLTMYTPLWIDQLISMAADPTADGWLRKLPAQLGLTGVVSGWIATTFGAVLKGHSASTPAKSPRQTPASATTEEKQAQQAEQLPSSESAGALVRFGPPVFALGLIVILAVSLCRFLPWIEIYVGRDALHSPRTTLEEKTSAIGHLRSAVYTDFFNLAYRPEAPETRQQEENAGRHHEWRHSRTRQIAYFYWQQANYVNETLLLVTMLAFTFAGLAFAWRVNINEFSMHHMYRNRLVRCYLGASNPNRRKAQPFTGFDPNDDIPMAALGKTVEQGSPLPIINTAINVMRGMEIAVQARKARSFTFTPFHCGYDLMTENDEHARSYSQPANLGGEGSGSAARESGGVRLGTAMSISGAAASPNQGYHSSPALAFLMTVFNVRLGWWMGNSRNPDAWRHGSPRFGVLYLLRELLGSANDEKRFVYLSDGGHFENLGIYELVRRRCSLIVAGDADCDPRQNFDDLVNVMERCRADFGVEIKFASCDLAVLRGTHLESDCNPPKPNHYLEAEIDYGGGRKGVLIYVKPSLCQEVPMDIAGYFAGHNDFPHETTADQFFDHAQFESYRRLGEHIAERAYSVIEQQLTNALGKADMAPLSRKAAAGAGSACLT